MQLKNPCFHGAHILVKGNTQKHSVSAARECYGGKQSSGGDLKDMSSLSRIALSFSTRFSGAPPGLCHKGCLGEEYGAGFGGWWGDEWA